MASFTTCEVLMRFNDGMSFDTSGPLRITMKSDGFYVVGQGMLIPIRDAEEGRQLIEQFSKEDRFREEVKK